MPSLKLMLFLPLAALALPAAARQAPVLAPVPAPAPAAEQGMVVVRDAETGKLRAPTPLEARALQPRMSAAAAAATPPKVVVGPGGRRSVRLGERHMVYSVVTRDSDGKLAEQCVHGPQAADSALAKPAPATKPEEHRHESR